MNWDETVGDYAMEEVCILHIQSGAEISGRTRVYHNQAGPG